MRHIVAKTSVQVVSADSSKCIRSEGSCDNNCFVSPIWIAYVGNECEVEVAGFLSSTCWSVIRYSSLRNGIRKKLDHLSYVKEYRDGGPNEGGLGVTVVSFE